MNTPKCRFCSADAVDLPNGNVYCPACQQTDDEPGCHDDSGDFPEPPETPLSEWVAAIMAKPKPNKCDHCECETCQPGTYHITPWDEVLCDECYQDGGYAAAINNGTAWFSDDFTTFEVKATA